MPRGPKPLRTKLKANEFYCVSCRGRVAVDKEDICVKAGTKKTHGVPMLKAQCAKCESGLNKFIKMSAVDAKRKQLGGCRRS